MAAARVRTDQVEITLLSCVISNTVALEPRDHAHLATLHTNSVVTLTLLLVRENFNQFWETIIVRPLSTIMR